MWKYLLCCDGCKEPLDPEPTEYQDYLAYRANLQRWRNNESDWNPCWFCPRCQLARSTEYVPKLPLTMDPT